MENKVEVVKKLEELLNVTRMGAKAGDELSLSYETKYEFQVWKNGELLDLVYEEAVVIYKGDNRVATVNVSCDSGVAIIRDVLRADYFN